MSISGRKKRLWKNAIEPEQVIRAPEEVVNLA
jgi:hypothetical protein